ncbi:flagellar biosynthesis protein FlgI [Sphingomonas oleivorans]|uniref:Flagellar biosynthesis protein FlgI n=1 Tax=Sphingomonas oleivorans TaxID=1735121 RepID=A0A2T5FUD7_9SPHN|nr:rod-binding protein [Sphingomonas oleivorans]PTQ08141.1 flagellar biosynthesis protein FlgI [Sphingomonas oleivorans]
MTIGAVSSAAAAPSASPADAEKQKLRDVAKQFEAVFLRQMIGSMRSAGLGDDILGSSATDQFRDMSDARTAESMAEKGVLGIAEMLIGQFGASGTAAVRATVERKEGK